MHERIAAELKYIERDHNVRILYACESGSRAWGFPSIDSDYDVRFIYARSAAEYLKILKPRDVIELALEPDLDLSGWDIYKTCELLRKTNPALLEWLGSPIVYCEDRTITEVLRSESKAHFNKRACCAHYLSMARSNYNSFIRNRELVRPKKYLYAIRPMLCLHWLLANDSFPPTEFAAVLDGVTIEPPLRRAIDNLIASKADQREIAAIEPIAIFETFLTSQLESLPERLQELPGTSFPAANLDKMLQSLLLPKHERD